MSIKLDSLLIHGGVDGDEKNRCCCCSRVSDIYI